MSRGSSFEILKADVSDVGVEGNIFAEGADEPGVDSDDDIGQTEAEVPIEAEPGTDSSQRSSKGPKEKGKRVFGVLGDYISNSRENFVAANTSTHPQK